MNGQMTYTEKIKMVEEFIDTVNPYDNPPVLNFDMRGYVNYIKENNLTSDNITEDVLNMFSK